MRLIDADNFLKRFSYQVPGDTIDAIDLRLALLNEPKVEAIPIEWIKDYVDFGVSDELAQRYRRFVLNMIKDLEKENDKETKELHQ